jgi:hypothetical protein
MNTIKISQAVANTIQEIRDAGKTPWIIINEDYLVAFYTGRTQAREGKAANNFAGQIVKADDLNFEVIKPLTPPVAHVEPELDAAGEEVGEVEDMDVTGNFEDDIKNPTKVTTPLLHKSEIENPCKRVFWIADEMFAANAGTKRREVLARCVAEGIAFYTARTQYQSWLQVRKEMADREAKQNVKK